MSKFLSFIVPTWNRAKQLEVAVRSIASQIDETDDIGLHIQDDCSTDGTQDVISSLQKDFPFITASRREKRTGYSDAFRDMFRHWDSKWVWTFGDDDRLNEGGLDVVLKILKDDNLQFIHVAERSRYSGTNGMYRGTLFDLCNTFGWIDMTGFITGNITRSEKLRQAAELPSWDLYAQTAFVQSCALLEVLKDDISILVDSCIIDTQDNSESEDTRKRWIEDNIAGRYMLLCYALEDMYNREVFKVKMRPAFFRYLDFHLWDRFFGGFLTDYINDGVLRPDSEWDLIAKLTPFISDDKVAKGVMDDIEKSKGLIRLHAYLQTNLNGLKEQLIEILNSRCDKHYPWGYVLPRDMLPHK